MWVSVCERDREKASGKECVCACACVCVCVREREREKEREREREMIPRALDNRQPSPHSLFERILTLISAASTTTDPSRISGAESSVHLMIASNTGLCVLGTNAAALESMER